MWRAGFLASVKHDSELPNPIGDHRTVALNEQHVKLEEQSPSQMAYLHFFLLRKLIWKARFRQLKRNRIVLLLRQHKGEACYWFASLSWRTPRLRPVNVGFPKTSTLVYVHFKQPCSRRRVKKAFSHPEDICEHLSTSRARDC